MSRIPFVLVLIDGNRLPITQRFIAQGALGGYLAAKQVRLTVENSLWRYGLNLSQFTTTRIVLFAELDKLARGCPQSHSSLQEFSTGFDSTDFETTFQDINRTFVSRKNLEVVLTRALYNPCCRYVVFLGPSWEIFKTFGNRLVRQGQMDSLDKALTIQPLSEVAGDVESSSMASSAETNIETRPTAIRRNHGVIMRGIKMVYDPTLYLAFDLKRDKRLENPSFRAWLTGGEQFNPYATGSGSDAPPNANPVPCTENSNAEWNHAYSGMTDRTAAEGGKAREDLQIESAAIQRSLFHDQPRNSIPRNRIGQRVDPPIDFDKELRAKMQKERWCSNYHLKGSCPIKECRFRHGTLDEDGKNALLSLSRGNYCRNGNTCEERDCYAGHQCPYDPCNKEETCHFPPEMHVTDKQIVNMKPLFHLP